MATDFSGQLNELKELLATKTPDIAREVCQKHMGEWQGWHDEVSNDVQEYVYDFVYKTTQPLASEVEDISRYAYAADQAARLIEEINGKY